MVVGMMSMDDVVEWREKIRVAGDAVIIEESWLCK